MTLSLGLSRRIEIASNTQSKDQPDQIIEERRYIALTKWFGEV